jgi:hypothetical protein
MPEETELGVQHVWEYPSIPVRNSVWLSEKFPTTAPSEAAFFPTGGGFLKIRCFSFYNLLLLKISLYNKVASLEGFCLFPSGHRTEPRLKIDFTSSVYS